MSQIPSGAPLGSERIDFYTNTAPLEAGVAKAVEIAKAGGAAAQAAVAPAANQTMTGPYVVGAEAMAKANTQLGVTADATTASFGKMRGAVMGLAIPFTLAVAAANRMASAWDENDAEMEEFVKSLDKDPIKALEQYAAKVEEVRSRTDSNIGGAKEQIKGWFNYVNPLNQYDLETQKEKLAVLEAQGAVLTKNADSERDRIEREKKAKQEEKETDLKEEVEDEILSRLEGEEKIAMEKVLWMEEMAKRRKALEEKGSDYEIYLLAKLDEAKQAGFAKRIGDIQKEKDAKTAADDTARTEKEQKDKESADRVAKHTADALGKALAGIQQQAQALFSPDKLGLQIQELGRIMQEVASNTRSLR